MSDFLKKNSKYICGKLSLCLLYQFPEGNKMDGEHEGKKPHLELNLVSGFRDLCAERELRESFDQDIRT